MKIYVKYCGGCNPRYDRAELVRSLQEELKECEFSESAGGQDVSLIVCGCPSACADKSDAAAPYGIFTIWQAEAAVQVKSFIREVSDML